MPFWYNFNISILFLSDIIGEILPSTPVPVKGDEAL